MVFGNEKTEHSCHQCLQCHESRRLKLQILIVSKVSLFVLDKVSINLPWDATWCKTISPDSLGILLWSFSWWIRFWKANSTVWIYPLHSRSLQRFPGQMYLWVQTYENNKWDVSCFGPLSALGVPLCFRVSMYLLIFRALCSGWE